MKGLPGPGRGIWTDRLGCVCVVGASSAPLGCSARSTPVPPMQGPPLPPSIPYARHLQSFLFSALSRLHEAHVGASEDVSCNPDPTK